MHFAQAIPVGVSLPEDALFKLQASFLGGEEIKTVPFQSLIKPNLEERTAIVRVLSTPERVSRYLCNEGSGNVVFTLTMADRILATATTNVGQRLRVRVPRC